MLGELSTLPLPPQPRWHALKPDSGEHTCFLDTWMPNFPLTEDPIEPGARAKTLSLLNASVRLVSENAPAAEALTFTRPCSLGGEQARMWLSETEVYADNWTLCIVA